MFKTLTLTSKVYSAPCNDFANRSSNYAAKGIFVLILDLDSTILEMILKFNRTLPSKIIHSVVVTSEDLPRITKISAFTPDLQSWLEKNCDIFEPSDDPYNTQIALEDDETTSRLNRWSYGDLGINTRFKYKNTRGSACRVTPNNLLYY